MVRRALLVVWALVLVLGAASARAAFDPSYRQWNALLQKHVHWLADGKQSRIDYDGFAADHAALKTVLDGFSAVTPSQFDAMPREQRMAFLINSYNAFTVDLVLTQWPKLKSIKDLGSLFSSPWKIEFFDLLGGKRNLDWIEHEQLRPVFHDPRVHTALNCASIGCPALRNEAFTAVRLDAQLDDGMRRFLGDRTRNRVADGRLQVSPIFKWYREDFENGDMGFNRLADVFARYAGQFSDDPIVQRQLAQRTLSIAFLDYDWSLNRTGN